MTIQERLPPGRYRLREEDYDRLGEAGVFGDARTELLDGEIIVMNAQHRPHGHAKMALYDAVSRALENSGSDLAVAVEVSVTLSEHDVPEPDLTLTSEPHGKGTIPRHSVALVVEVSDTTMQEDLGRKRRLYAIADIPEYWVADLTGRVLHHMWQPANGQYARHEKIAFGSPVTAATIPGLTIATDRL